MPEITVIVEFEVVEGREAEFAALMLQHARKTLDEESGCRRFEVIQPMEPDGSESAGRLLVHELYADEAAYEAHKASPRMPGLQAATAPLLHSRRLVLARPVRAEADAPTKRPEDLNASNDD